MTIAGRGAARTMAALVDGGAPPAPPRNLCGGLAGAHPVFEVGDDAMDEFRGRLPGGRGRRSLRLAIVAASDAVREATSAGPIRVTPERFGVIVGATVGGMNHAEDWIEDWCGSAESDAWARPATGLGATASPAAPSAPAMPSPRAAVTSAQASLRGAPLRRVARRPAIRHARLCEVPDVLAARFGLRGPAFVIPTACTSGAQAIATAAELISTGACDAVLAGGVDCLARLTYNGFAALGVMSPRRCAPFDAGRAGLNLGEGAAFVLLVRADLAPEGAGRFPVLAGWGSNTDAHHMTAPRPDGSGVAAAIRDALGVGGLAPSDVGWVHAHGTATMTNDAVEATGVRTVFASHRVPVSSTKHVFGHTLGAAGAISSVVALLALREGFTPGNAPIASPDSACDVAVVPPEGLRAPLRRAVISSLGFSGASCALVFEGAAP